MQAEQQNLPQIALPEPELDYVLYLFTDDDGKEHTLHLQKSYLAAVRKNIEIGRKNARTTKWFLEECMNEEDTDGNRRHFRAAVAYLIDHGILICSTVSGYFVADSAEEVEACVSNKEKQAESNLKRARRLRAMDVERSKQIFRGE
jgi:hypothetical protein